MIGHRLPDIHDIYNIPILEPGQYVRITRPGKKDFWLGASPNGEQGNMSNHTIDIHPDGTISVTPSVWFDTPKGWHGFLTKGIWIIA